MRPGTEIRAATYLRRLAARSAGQSATEYALITSLLLVGSLTLQRWLPDMMNALSVYLYGIYYIVGTPLG
jgi:hypothetical protein